MTQRVKRTERREEFAPCNPYDKDCFERQAAVTHACVEVNAAEYLDDVRECAAYRDAGACTEAVDCTQEARDRFEERRDICIRYS